jgi:hypothetical protein
LQARFANNHPEPEEQQSRNTSEESTDNHGKKRKKGPALAAVPVDVSMPPPAWLPINPAKHKAVAFAHHYPPSSQLWFSEEYLSQQASALIVKPRPEGGDRGIPVTRAEEIAFGKQVYDAIVDFGHFYGSSGANGGVVARLLDGRFPSWYIIARSMDVVEALKQYHTVGLVATEFANANVQNDTGIQLKDSEQDDTCELRKVHILQALRFCKSVACDVLEGKGSLASVLILAPKRKIVTKIAYKESNDGRAQVKRSTEAQVKQQKLKDEGEAEISSLQ